jgi:uncharacterized protein YdaU (DUF1376 family)
MMIRPARDLSGLEIVHPEVVKALRVKAGAERLRLAHEAWELARARLTAFFASTHADWSPKRVRQEVARRLSRDSG